MLKKTIILLTFISILVSAQPAAGYFSRNPAAKLGRHEAPRLANLFLKTPITTDEARALARWDVVILGIQAQDVSPEAILLIRQLNPNVVILGYTLTATAPLGFVNDIEPDGRGIWHSLITNLGPQNYLTNTLGERLDIWPGMPLFDLRSRVNNRDLPIFLAHFWRDYALETNFWDGLFFDNSEGTIDHVAKGADLDSDGVAESAEVLNAYWQTGLTQLFTEMDRDFGNDFLIVGNGRGVINYAPFLSGAMLESFPNAAEGSWSDSMNLAEALKSKLKLPKLLIIHSDTGNTGKIMPEHINFTLSSAQLLDAWYAHDYGSNDHSQLWWFRPYNFNLGSALGPAYSTADNQEAVHQWSEQSYRRDFKGGVVIVDPNTYGGINPQ